MASYRRTRFVCISDTHNASPADGCFKLPKGDVLIHAGDLTKQGTVAELRKTIDWLEKAEYEAKIVVAGHDLHPIPTEQRELIHVAGNHDVTLDAAFYAEYGSDFHNQSPQSSLAALELLAAAPSLTYLEHTSAHVRLAAPSGPRTHFRVFGSPYSPATSKAWAFTYKSDAASALWSKISLATDIVVAHTPPHCCCDEAPKGGGNTGCLALRDALQHIRPRMLVCGHVHEGRGVQRLAWDADFEQKNRQGAAWCWKDGGLGGKMSLVDVSARSEAPLKNDGELPHESRGKEEASDNIYEETLSSLEEDTLKDGDEEMNAEGEQVSRPKLPPANEPAKTISPSSTSSTGRKETLVVNAAIMASSWPYKGAASGRWNKPIVVDLDLPVWGKGDEEDGKEDEGEKEEEP